MQILTTNHVTKSFDGQTIIEDISMELNEKEIVCLLGVSGAGKTTLFNVIAGLSVPDDGNVMLNGENITGKAGHVSYMLQKDLLLPYRTIEENIALPLIIKGEKKAQALRKVRPHFAGFDLEGTEKNIRTSFPAGCGSGQHFFGHICLRKGWRFSMNRSVRLIRLRKV